MWRSSLRAVVKPVIVVAVIALVAAGCGGSEPETCDEVAVQTIVLMQDLIDDVEKEFGEESLDEIIARMLAGEELPSVVAFEEQADDLSQRAGELGCTQEGLEEAVATRTDRLEATTPLGEFIIDGIERGGL